MMKTLITFCAVLCMTTSFAQTVNWKSLKPEQKHTASLNTGVDYSVSFGAAYGYQLKMNVLKSEMPVMLQAQISIPSGKDLVDDFKSKLGAQVRVYQTKNFAATLVINANFRAHKTDLVKMQSFGSEFAGIFGYYKPKWFVAGEFGFDKAIATHVKHSSTFKEFYPDVHDGWYVPTAGNFNAGLQSGYSMKTFDVFVKGGLLWDQYFNKAAYVPYYAQVGVSKRF